ncbi:MAG TPA: hypothetical protein VFS05_05585 [Gemmatimonadaceae bacterium]|nr:hypothetical protein [Gemmatimonadaceae bacterium]
MRATYPPHPFPPPAPFPPAEPAPRAPMQPPMVYVSPEWEYRRLDRSLGAEAPPTEEELNALGAEGWELAAVVTAGERAWFYLKRLRE